MNVLEESSYEIHSLASLVILLDQLRIRRGDVNARGIVTNFQEADTDNDGTHVQNSFKPASSAR
jgi:hypothetical protein